MQQFAPGLCQPWQQEDPEQLLGVLSSQCERLDTSPLGNAW